MHLSNNMIPASTSIASNNIHVAASKDNNNDKIASINLNVFKIPIKFYFKNNFENAINVNKFYGNAYENVVNCN